ncbi:MAG TPA: hypothetical protein VED01_18890 [Burkholderiales bacterium]|nr:hypothetical protein [Burkholderiales bacterium]
MELQALPVAPRPTQRPVQLVLVRANGPLFYSLAAASILEATMPLAADRLLHFFASDRTLATWVTSEWLPRKRERARNLRAYVESTWPEYDWMGGAEQFRAAASAGGGLHQPTAAHEALARCVATAQSGIFYRSLARWADDARLRELARVMALEEAESFAQFRGLYDRRLRVQGFGCTAAWTTALSCVRAARDSQVPRAFHAISAHCAPHVPFPVLDYSEFLVRMGSVIERHGNLGTPERVLFRTWKGRPRVRLPEAAPPQVTTFRPVLGRAA